MSAWETTHGYTFRPPTVAAGYTGHVPDQHVAAAAISRTYGDVTACSMQARRQRLLCSSASTADREALPPLKKFPTTNSNDPSLVLANRKRTRERFMAAKRYQLWGEGTKENYQQSLFEMCQRHREAYNDKSGTVQPIACFVLPKIGAPGAPKFVPMLSGAKGDAAAAPRKASGGAKETASAAGRDDVVMALPERFRGTTRQRAIRDQVFEKR